MSKPIDVRDQPILSFRRTAQITANGIRYRLFRSLVTVVVVAVAVAFLMNILSESLIKKSIGERTRARVAEMRAAAAWSGRLTSPGTTEEILLALARAERGDAALREAQAMGKLSDAETHTLHEAARTAASVLVLLDKLDYAHRRALVHNARGADMFGRLAEPAGWERFTAALAAMRSVRFPLALDAFRGFLADWPAVEALTARLQEGRRAAIARVADALDGRPVIEALAEADGAFGDTIRGAGFAFEPAAGERVARQARRMLAMRRLEKSIGQPEVRQAVAGRLDLLPADVNIGTLWRLLRRRRDAAWYLEQQRQLGGAVTDLPVARAVELAEIEAEVRALGRAERLRVHVAAGGFLGIGERMSWLVVASMLVCVVGISNAMLMSVTERFREIATLKCLGALDGFIMVMFVLEACVLGVVGGVVGAVLGCLLGLGRMLAGFGALVGSSLPTTQVLAAMGFSLALGVVLAAVASVYPSFKAARLAPMEAMRIQ